MKPERFRYGSGSDTASWATMAGHLASEVRHRIHKTQT